MKCALVALLMVSAMAVSGAAAAEGTNVAETAPGSQPTRIALLAGPGLEDLANRFSAELASLHFEVVRLAAAPESSTPAALEGLAREQQARAAVRIAAAEGAIDLWLVNPTTHEAVYRRIVAERDPAVAVLRSLEILRGSLIDLRALSPKPAAPAPTPKPEPVAPLPATPAPAPRALWFGLSAAATSLDARHSPAWGALAGLHFAVSPKFGLHAAALVPLNESSVSGQGGRVRAWAGAFAFGGSVAPWGERTFTPALGLGVAALALHTRGEANAGFRGTSDLNVVAWPHARLAATLRLSTRLRACAQVLAGFATPRPVLLLADERNAAWVNPLLSGALGLEVTFN